MSFKVLRRSQAFFVLMVVLVAAVSASAQLGTGTILGSVRDSTGSVLSGANVTVINVDTNTPQSTVTNAEGNYRVPALKPGNYTVRVEQQGFKAAVQTGVVLAVTQEATVNITLAVGATTQEVVVNAEAQQVDTTTSTLGGLVNEERIADLPLNGRNFIDLGLLQVGITKQLNLAPSLGTGGTEYSSNGAPFHSNNYLLDGAAINNFYGGGPSTAFATSLGVDGIKEFRMLTNNFTADYGMSMGSQVILVSKNGTNQFHGDVFEYLRNASLDARNYFDSVDAANVNGFGTNKSLAYPGKRIPPFRRNDFGGSFGGPIRRNKTFFYAVYEGLRVAMGTTNVNTTLGAGCHGVQGAVITTAACPQLGTVVCTAGVPGCTPGSSGSVTIGAASAAVIPLINLYPNPNLPSNGYTFPFMEPQSENYGQIRVDHTFSNEDSLFVRYTVDYSIVTFPIAGFLLATQDDTNHNQSFTVSETHIFSPTLLNNIRISGTNSDLYTLDSRSSNLTSVGQFIPGYPIGPVDVTGLTTYGSQNITAKGALRVITASDDIFYSRGRNSFKFGILVNYFQPHSALTVLKTGRVGFPNVTNFLQGKASTETGQTPASVANSIYSYDTFGFYVQDDLRATPRLTLNLGLRYEFRTQVNSRGNRSSSLRNLASDTANTVGPIIANATFKNFSPRLGFAWDVFGNGKTSLRGGAGLLYDIALYGPVLNAIQPPFVTNFSIPNPALFQIPFDLSNVTLAVTGSTKDWNTKQPMMLQYNLAVQRQLPSNMLLSVAYAGSHGYNLLMDKGDGNDIQAPFHGFVTNRIGCNGVAAPANVPDGWPCFASAVSTCGVKIGVGSCRLNPNFTSIGFSTFGSKSWYNSLQVEITKKMTHGLQFQSSYTWSKSLDMGQSGSGADGSANAGLNASTAAQDAVVPFFNNKAPSSYDALHNWQFNALYHFPKLFMSEGIVSKALDGWWVGGIYSLQTGYPFYPTIGNNRPTYGVSGAGAGGGLQRPDYVTAAVAALHIPCVGPGNPSGEFIAYDANTVVTKNPRQWFNPCMFMTPAQGYTGTAGRNILRAAGVNNLDFSINKDTPLKLLGEQGSVQIRAEFFNILNHPAFAYPNVSGGTTAPNALNVFAGTGAAGGGPVEQPVTNIGQILSTASNSRQVQVALKIVF